jgi:ribonuclease HII
VSRAPSLRFERDLLRTHGVRWLASVDEVGRGALGGPVSVGVVLVDLRTPAAPAGVRDSKLLSPAARARLVPLLQRWAPAWAVAHATAAEIDAVGILRALRLAGERAFASLPQRPDHVLLDGSYDWLSRPAPALFDDEGVPSDPDAWTELPPVTLKVKADMSCSSVAAASVLAKTTRDAMMVDLAAVHPAYGWELNKGYSSPEHLDALRRIGPCDLHRRSWAIPGGPGDLAADGVAEHDEDGLREDSGIDLRGPAELLTRDGS